MVSKDPFSLYGMKLSDFDLDKIGPKKAKDRAVSAWSGRWSDGRDLLRQVRKLCADTGKVN